MTHEGSSATRSSSETDDELVDCSISATTRISIAGSFRVRGDLVELFPSHFEDRAWRLSFFGDESKVSGKSIR